MPLSTDVKENAELIFAQLVVSWLATRTLDKATTRTLADQAIAAAEVFGEAVRERAKT
jgi:hypothetical protein